MRLAPRRHAYHTAGHDPSAFRDRIGFDLAILDDDEHAPR